MRVLCIPARDTSRQLLTTIGGKTILDHHIDVADEWLFPEVVVSVLPEIAEEVRPVLAGRGLLDFSIDLQPDEDIAIGMNCCLNQILALPDDTEITFLLPDTLFSTIPDVELMGVQRVSDPMRPGPTFIAGACLVKYVRDRSTLLAVDAVNGRVIPKFSRDDNDHTPGLVSVGVFTHTLKTWKHLLNKPGLTGYDFLDTAVPEINGGAFGFVAVQLDASVFGSPAAD